MKLKGYKKSLLIYIVLYLAIFVAAYAGFFAQGRTLVTKMDGVNQFYQGFLYCGIYIRTFVKQLLSGHPGLPLYDLNIGMGEDIVGVLSYYGVGDPVYLISVFANSVNGPYLFSATYFFRLFIAGLSFLYYFREMKINENVAPIGALCMVINGYTFGGVSSYMGWGSVLFYMPIILVGVERIFKGKKGFALIVLGAFYGGICDFYHLYMICIFLICYCIGRGLSIFGIKDIKSIVGRSLHCAFAVIVGICLSGPLFFTSAMGFMGSERAEEISVFDILLNPKNYIPYKGVYMAFLNQNERFYFKYVNKITIAEYISVVAALFLPKSNAKKQLCTANIVTMLTVGLPITGYIFSAFGESGFIVNVRWTFLVHFLFATTLVYVLSADWGSFMKKYGKYLVIAAYVAVVLNLSYYVVRNGHGDGGRLDVENVSRNTDSPVTRSETVMKDPDIFRVSTDRFLTTADRPENTAMIKGYRGITYWFSIMNNYTQTFVNEVTNTNEDWRSDGYFHDPTYETMSGVKYYFSKGANPIPEGYVKIEDFEYYGEQWSVYKNTAYYGFSYVRNAEESEKLWENRTDYKSYFSDMAKKALEDESVVSEKYDNFKNEYRLTVNAKAGDELVVSIPYIKEWTAYVDGARTEIGNKDIMFMTLPLDEGTHEVLFKYHNRGFYLGLLTVALGIVMIAIYAFITHKRFTEER